LEKKITFAKTPLDPNPVGSPHWSSLRPSIFSLAGTILPFFHLIPDTNNNPPSVPDHHNRTTGGAHLIWVYPTPASEWQSGSSATPTQAPIFNSEIIIIIIIIIISKSSVEL
jgi:hypothetical protein